MTLAYLRRRITNHLMLGLTFASALIAIVPLFFILYQLISKGAQALNLDFFTHLPVPVGELGGGMGHAVLGTAILIGLACSIGLPIGILGGIYLSEFATTRLAHLVRFSADMLSGVPSIVMGLFAYALIVLPMKHFSALGGGVALGIMMIPTVMRTTEEMLLLVPHTLREAAFALGIPYWRTLFSIVVTTARGGIMTGVLLAIARISGETAPLLFTALGNHYWSTALTEPIAALPLQIFTYAISPFQEWQAQAWAGALVLIGLVFVLNIGARLVIRDKWEGKA